MNQPNAWSAVASAGNDSRPARFSTHRPTPMSRKSQELDQDQPRR